MRGPSLLVVVLIIAANSVSSGCAEGGNKTSTERTIKSEIVFTRTVGEDGRPDLYVMSSDGSRTRLLTRNARNAAVSRDGSRIAFVRARGIWVMRRDGSAQRRLTKPSRSKWSGFDWPAWSPDSLTLYFARYDAERSQLYSIDMDGQRLRRVGRTSGGDRVWDEGMRDPAPSPDGRLIAYANLDDWYRGDGGSLEAMTAAGRRTDLSILFRSLDDLILEDSLEPAWAPDGRSLAYAAGDPLGPSRADGLFVSRSSRPRSQRLVASHSYMENRSPAWSPDGTVIAFVRVWSLNGPGEIWLVGSDGKDLRQLTSTGAYDADPAWLPPKR